MGWDWDWVAKPFEWVPDIVMGFLGAHGQAETNKANLRIAREQMDFQERMSSTAAQRSVEDYRKAGLNPALAYDRTASSPGGASAVMGNVAAAGVSTAMAARQQRQAMDIARQQNEADLGLKRSQMALMHNQSEKASRETKLLEKQVLAAEQAIEFAKINQPYDSRIKLAEAMLAELQLPGARNTAAFEEMMGKAGKGVATARTAAEIIKLLNPRQFRR